MDLLKQSSHKENTGPECRRNLVVFDGCRQWVCER